MMLKFKYGMIQANFKQNLQFFFPMIFHKYLLNIQKHVKRNQNDNYMRFGNKIKIYQCTKYLEVWSALKIMNAKLQYSRILK